MPQSSWSPNPLAPNTQSTLKTTKNYDPTGTAPLTNTNVRYNLIIFDKNNQPVKTKNLLAKNAADTETIVFATKEIYHMELQITGFTLSRVRRLILQGME